MSEIRVNSVIAEGGSSAPNLAYGAQVPTGMGITGAGGINVTGIVTATSFSGDGTNLTNVGVDTASVDTGSLTVSGITTFSNTTDSTSSTTGSLIISGGVGIAKSLFVGNNVTIGGTLTYEDVTNIDSVGIVTAQLGVIATAGRGVQITAGGLNVAAGVGTFKGILNADAEVTAAGGVDVAGGVKVGAALTVVGALDVDGATTLDTVTIAEELTASGGVDVTGGVKVGAALTVVGAFDVDGATTLDAVTIAETATLSGGVNVGGGVTMSTAGITTFSKAVYFNDGLTEQCVIVANRLSSAQNIDIEQGNVWYFSTNETGASTPNIRWNGSVALDDRMKVGETINVAIIYKPNGAGYYASLNVDGTGVTEEWLGGSAPSSASAGGYDILTHQLIKTGTDTWICLSNVQNYA